MTVNTKTDTTQPPKHLVKSFKKYTVEARCSWTSNSTLQSTKRQRATSIIKKTIPNMSGLVVPSTSLLSLQLKFHTTQSRHRTARSKTKENPKGVRGIQSAIESCSSNRNLGLVTKTRRGLSCRSRPVKRRQKGSSRMERAASSRTLPVQSGAKNIATSSTLKPRHVSRLSSPRHIRFTQEG